MFQRLSSLCGRGLSLVQKHVVAVALALTVGLMSTATFAQTGPAAPTGFEPATVIGYVLDNVKIYIAGGLGVIVCINAAAVLIKAVFRRAKGLVRG